MASCMSLFATLDGYPIASSQPVTPETFSSGEYVLDGDYSEFGMFGRVFSFDSTLTGIYLPNSITGIDNSCFMECRNLKEIHISSSVTSIGDSCFDHAGFLSIVIPSTVTKLGTAAFAWCEKLKTADIQATCVTLPEMFMVGCLELTTLSIKNVGSLSSQCFYDCTALEIVNISAEMTTIDSNSFLGCTQQGLTFNITRNTPEFISGAPWGATNATICYYDARDTLIRKELYED